MLADKNTVVFLTNDMVEERLRGSMTNWVQELFLPLESEQDIDVVIKRQVQVGHVHARIDLPMSLVNFGMRTLKSSMAEVITESTLESAEKFQAVVLSERIVDTMVALINESYLNDIVVNEKNAQAFRMHVSSQSLAFDCERLRTSLLDWVRQILTCFHEDKLNIQAIPTIRHSDFGLWLTHKGALILSGRSELSVLMQFVSDANTIVDKAINLDQRKGNPEFNALIDDLNEHVTNVVWLLGNTAQEMMDLDSGRDALTHLFNRRYLDTVMRHETECSLKTGMRFALLYMDIDFFKTLNDRYGHENGDLVLQQFSALLSSCVRTGDFVFRYGGEEFLVVLADVQEQQVPHIAEKVRNLVESSKFYLEDETEVPVTISIGAAYHDGHPDYQRTIRNADSALYHAKENGRNQVVVFDIHQ